MHGTAGNQNITKPKAIVLRTAGTNCDYETKAALELAGAAAERVHINRLINRDIALSDYQILAIPGGFSYGDDIASGKILANELKYRLGDMVREFDATGKPIIGICNGFQVLVKMGLLPGDKYYKLNTTLTFNDSGFFECRWVYLKKSNTKGSRLWLEGLPDVFPLPVAHGEGKFITMDKTVLDAIEGNKQVIVRYSDTACETAAYPLNPNGSANNIAGICNAKGNVFGLMPHPERFVYRWQHPDHRSGFSDDDGFGPGLKIFKNAVHSVK